MMPEVIVLTISKEELQTMIQNAVLSSLSSLKTAKPEEKFLTRKEIAQAFKVSLTTINSWSRSGKLKRRYMGARVYFLQSEVEALLKKK